LIVEKILWIRLEQKPSHCSNQTRLHPVYLDTETTGTGPADEVIEIGIVDEDGKYYLSRW